MINDEAFGYPVAMGYVSYLFIYELHVYIYIYMCIYIYIRVILCNVCVYRLIDPKTIDMELVTILVG